MERIRIVLADDHPVFIQGLISILRNEKNIEILGQASDGQTALTLIQKYKPDIAILDVQMPGPDGFELAQRFYTEQSPVKIIILTMFKEESFIKKVLDLGVRGYVLKENAIDDIIDSINIVFNGGIYLSDTVCEIIRNYKEDLISGGIQVLTPSEKKIIVLIGQGMTSKIIAERLFVSVKTVNNHRSNICKKLGITGTSALMKYALSKNINT